MIPGQGNKETEEVWNTWGFHQLKQLENVLLALSNNRDPPLLLPFILSNDHHSQTLLSSFPKSEFNTAQKWEVGPRMDRERPRKRPVGMTRGKQWRARSLWFFSFWIPSFSILSPPSKLMATGNGGKKRSCRIQNWGRKILLIQGAVVLRWRYFFLLLSYCLALDSGTFVGNKRQSGITTSSIFWADDWKETPWKTENTREITEREEVRKRLHKVAYELLGSTPCCTYMDLTLNSIYRLWELNCGIDHCPSLPLGATHDG